MVRHRRHLHQNPEVGINLPDTHQYVLEQLQACGLDPEFHPGAGISVLVRGAANTMTPMVFRADMDALPVQENPDVPFRSARDGAMHACGHDLHTATLLGLAQDLVDRPTVRDVVLVFQPGEESHRGALKVLQHKNLQLKTAEAFAVHVNAVMPTGSIAYSRGTFMAYGDWFLLDIHGPGGHASAPERAGNPVRAGSQFVEELVSIAQELSTRRGRVVATVTEFLSGNTVNVIPTQGSLRGTIRSVTESQREELHTRMHELCDHMAVLHGLEISLSITTGYPAVISEPDFVNAFLGALEREGLGGHVKEMEHPSMVIEDFSYFLHRWPGAMVYVGAAVGENPSFNHSAGAQFDEDAMKTSFAVFRALAPAAESNGKG